MPRKPHNFHYIYKTECIPTGKYYIGMHSSYIDPSVDDYLGSGIHLRRSIRKWGALNHKREILEFCENRQTLKEREAVIVNESLLNDPLCMNLRQGGGGYDESQRPNFKGWEFANKFWDSEDGKKRREEIIPWNKGKSFKINPDKIRKGIKTTQGKVWLSNKEHNENSLIDKSLVDEYLNNGWELGRLSYDRSASKGKLWINNPSEGRTTLVNKSLVDEYLNNGWKLGKKIRNSS